MNANVCPHYNAYTLWWTGMEREVLTCPPDFKYNCCAMVQEEEEYEDMVFEDEDMIDHYEATIELEAREHEIHQSEIKEALKIVKHLFDKEEMVDM